jgi:solute carrier family 13 (sodium-dependent dicarboxylate transporter), member 2/3/5
VTSTSETRPALIALLVGPLLFALVLAVPLDGVPGPAHRLAAVFVWVVAYWATEAIPLPATSLLGSVLCILLGVAPAGTVLAPYADPVIFLFVGSFILAQAMRSSGLDRRFAWALLRREWATRTPGRLLATLGVVTCAISLWVSNTATTAMMLPVGMGILAALGPAGDPARSRFPIGLLLMLTWSSSVAVGIPVGSPPNLIAIGLVRNLTGQRLTFFDWTAVTMPITLVMLVLCWLILRRRYPVQGDTGSTIAEYVTAQRAAMGQWTRAQRNVAVVFGLACAGWMLPGAVAIATGAETPAARLLEARLPESAVALGAAVLLFVLPTDLARREFTLTWRDALRIEWGTILLFGGGLSLGRLMFETGLAETVGRALVRLSGAESVWALTAMAILVGVTLSETSSNTASASMVVPVVIAVAGTAGVSPIPPAIGAALGASLGFMLPVSTPPNAIVYGTGLVPLREMIRAGLWLDVAGGVVIWVSLRVLCPALGVM